MRNFFSQLLSSRYIRLGFGILLSGLAFFWMSKQVDFVEMWGIFRTANLSYVGMAIGSVCLNNLGKTFRWRVLLGKSGDALSFLVLLKTVFAGQLMNIMLPGRVGDIVRVLMLVPSVSKAYVLGTIVVEKLIETLAFIMLFAFTLILLPLPDWLENSSLTWFVIGVMGSIVLIVGVSLNKQILVLSQKIAHIFPERVRLWIVPHLEPGFACLTELKKKHAFFIIFFWTCIIWMTAVLNNYFGMKALGIQLPISASVILLIALQVGIVTSASPGAVGIFEIICILVLGYFGIERSLAVGYGLLLHVLIFVPQVVGGIWSMLGWNFAFLNIGTEG